MPTYCRTDEQGFTVWTCPGCGGSSHPATGCQYTAGHVWCWRCTLDAARWIQSFTNGKGRRRGPAFYDFVAYTASGTWSL